MEVDPPSAMDEKLQKLLANAGYGSRRQIETWISQGRIKVNGKTATLGDRARSVDRISVDGKPATILRKIPCKVIAYHKPVGEICTRWDPERRKTLFDQLPKLSHGRWVSVGRLDINTSGLILLTNNGTLAHHLMHPSSEVEREYAVRVLGAVTKDILQHLRQGVELEDGIARFDAIHDAGGKGANHWYHVMLKEGRNHEVRRLWEALGVTVSRLIRIRFGPIVLLRQFSEGRWVILDRNDISALMQLVGMSHG